MGDIGKARYTVRIKEGLDLLDVDDRPVPIEPAKSRASFRKILESGN